MDDTQTAPNMFGVKQALVLAALLAAAKLILQVGANLWGMHLGYSYARDELYFLICGHHLAWGYVDQPPLVAVQARLSELIFGTSPTGVRMLTSLAGAVKVGLAGMLAWSLGGRRPAQFVAMVATLCAAVYLIIDGYLSMNSFEPVFWMGCLLALIWMARGGDLRWWVAVGILGGLGVENKHSTVFFLIALAAALLLTPQRRLLFNKWFAAALGLVVLLSLPNFVWEWQHHWATYELLKNVAQSGKNVEVGPLAFAGRQLLMLSPLSVPLWIGGLAWLLVGKSAREFRFVGVLYLLFFALMVVMKAKDYYVAPIYPVLFAAGGVGLERLAGGRRWPALAYATLMALGAAIFAPVFLTLLSPPRLLAFQEAMHLSLPKNETEDTAILPQYVADKTGWPDMVERFAHAFDGLSLEDRAHVGIYCGNYGEASAINFLGAKYGLPTAISGHQNYFYWGPQGYSGDLMLVIGGDREDYEKSYQSVTEVERVTSRWVMPYERRPIFLCRGRKGPFDWEKVKRWR